MPNVYVRKSEKGTWTEENLVEAVHAIQNDSVSIRAASRQFSVPESTIRNRLKRNDFVKRAMGPDSQLGSAAEAKLVGHIKKLQAVGFAPTQREVRVLAYELAQKLDKKTSFSSDMKMAGKVWFSSFLRRNAELSIRKAQGISRARTEGMNRAEVKRYFTLLSNILTENNLLDKPACIWNCDEIGIQLNNEPKKVVAAKGSKDVHVVTSAEKGETISILACCSAEGQFLPPFCIFKGVYAKPQYGKGAPPGTSIKMRKESAYMSSELFMSWITDHFIPRKPPGKNLLILDGHASHMSNVQMLELALENDIIILCLPSHTTHYLQPLDRVVFKPFKTYFKDACGKLVANRHGTGKITRDDFGELLNSAWSRSATVQLATSAFRATGIYPLNIDAIPEHAYLLFCDQNRPGQSIEKPSFPSTSTVTPPSSSSNSTTRISRDSASSSSSCTNLTVSPAQEICPMVQPASCQPSTSKCTTESNISFLSSIPISSDSQQPQSTLSVSEPPAIDNSEITPNKALSILSPVPCSLEISRVKRKISAVNVTDPEYINSKIKKNNEKINKKRTTKGKRKVTFEGKKTKKDMKKHQTPLSLTDEDNDVEIELLSNNVNENDNESCAECFELYCLTTSKSDWIQCILCKKWLHESCSLYPQKCVDCGRKEVRQRNVKK